MANILRGYGLAREQGYFKQEQEADLQRHKQRLIKEGRLPPDSPKGPQPSMEDSAQTFEVLFEVLSQQARVEDPEAAARKEYERRIKGEPPPLGPEELRRYRAASAGAGGGMYVIGAAVGHVPRTHLGRGRYQAPQAPAPSAAEGFGDWTLGPRALSPEAREAARRSFLASVRSLVYGSVAAAVGLASGATLAVWALEIHSAEDLRAHVQQGFAPASAAIRGWLLPVQAAAQRWLGGGGAATAPRGEGGGLLAGSEFQRRLKERYASGKPHTGPE
eukprot:scaffold13.g251.t1